VEARKDQSQPPATTTPVQPPPVADRMSTPPQWQGQPTVSNAAPPAPTNVAQPTDRVGGNPVVARSDTPAPTPTQVPAAVAPTPGARKMPPLQIVNDREILVEYELSKVGPSGIGSVELWLSEDGGKTWGDTPFADDPDAKSSASGGKYQRTLQLPKRDGVYGLYMIVRNSVGLGKPKPRPGDAPEMLIEVDTTPPIAQLWPPEPVAGKRDTVLLRWTATDKNLAANPVTLEWADRQEGPWHVIGTPDMVNVGSHEWKLPAQIPARVLLRVRAKDSAGNEAVAAFQEPQLVDLSVPEGALIRVQSAPRH
jgi:hypothetical protein